MTKTSIFGPQRSISSRKLDEFIPDDALGLPESVFEDKIDEEVIRKAVLEARKHQDGYSTDRS